ncbi:hypothetical protein B0T14DRAFT_464229 [Immersiella caudata]|uniref:Uncharacterized protein n=1 Tax=Immersiella caudata TaxID=314043 RepID=A0AA39T1K2_9PEZI|nr:hypothetical protein B0T14DRAFT_464229 [Immersiella caudata]
MTQCPPSAQKRPNYEQYEAYIRACFSRWPASAGFYQGLINHLQTASSAGWSQLQKPRTYPLGSIAGRSDQSDTSSAHETTSLRSKSSISSSSCSLSSPTPSAKTEQARLRQQPHITVVEGFLAPETIGILGEWYQTRPEFFIDHLAPSESCGYGSEQNAQAGRCELPLLPSQRDNIIHVRFFSQLKLPSKGWKPQSALAQALSASPAGQLGQQREQSERRRQKYEQQLSNCRRYGVTRFRALHVHNEQCLTVEQIVSFTVRRESDRVWHGLFLLDGGRDCHHIDLPWAEQIETGADPDDRNAGFVPIVPYNIPVSNDETATPQPRSKRHSPYHPGADISAAAASSGVEAQLLIEDPFYILSCVYHAAARTRIQLLDFVESEIRAYSSARGRQQDQVPEQLQLNADLIGRVERFCREDLANIIQLGSRQWPRSEQAAELNMIRDNLRGDYEHLIEKCTSIDLRCERAISALVGLAQREESRAGVRESHSVANLTMLAVIFIPLSYVCSVFSMNVTSIIDGVQIWIWAAVSVISLILTCVAMWWWKRRH